VLDPPLLDAGLRGVRLGLPAAVIDEVEVDLAQAAPAHR
jgi:hypothetical protein